MNSLSQTNPLLLTNMSNEFNLNDMKDNINYQYALKDLGSSNEIPKAFLNKPRIVKEMQSVGGFRIPEESLKKRVEPSNYMPLLGQSSNLAGGFSAYPFNNDAFNPVSSNSNANLWVEDNHNIDYLAKHSGDASLSENLISVFEQEVQKLKREAQNKYGSSSFTNLGQNTNKPNDIHEDKTYTEYMAFNPSRVQAIKHVTTNFKPEYMTLEEIQRQREEHLKVLLKTENEFYEKKKNADRNIDLYNSTVNMHNDKFATGIPQGSQMNSSTFNMQDVNALINHEEQHFNKSIRSKPQRGRSAQKLVKYNDTYDRCLSKDESKYIKKFMNYLLKKKYKEANDQEFNEKEDWNTTRVRSLNKKSVNLSRDGPGRLDTGHLDKKDYSLYYLSIESDSPRSLSLKSGSSRSYSGQKLNRKKIRAQQLSETHPVQYGSSHKSTRYIDSNEMSKANYNKSNTNFNSTVKSSSKTFSSSLAFVKMIFNLLDVGRIGSIKISELEKTMNLDPKIMIDLGFENQDEFMRELKKFQTAVDGEVNEDEFCGFLLSKSQHCEEYLYSYMQGNLHGSAFAYTAKSNVPQAQIQEYSENLDSRHGSMFKTNKSFNGLASQTLSKYNTSKSAQYMMNLKRQIVNDKLKISYNDYKEFVKGYKARKELNVTIPNPPSFYDKKGKREKKIQEIVEERKKQEDEVLGYRFKPNELKREIFISQLGNIIEAERAKRTMRQEKIKQKIVQEMKPFSFYDADEKKYKDKLSKECCPPEFLPFKANPIPWTSQVNLYEDIITKQEKDREARIEERARQNLQIAKLPPRMELHEKKKKLQEDEIKNLEKNTTKSTIRSKSTSKVARVPDFAKEHENFIKEMEKKKSIAKPTEPKPFTFHEPKKKAALRNYLDDENNPQVKNPHFKKNIEDILSKIQQKPKIEPASTKGLDLLMEYRRRNLEAKQKEEEKQKEDEARRKIEQNKLKERVTQSKHLVDNSKQLDKEKKEKQENFKKNLVKQKIEYQTELEKLKQKVYNKPLMFEKTYGSVKRLEQNQHVRQVVEDYLQEPEQTGNQEE